MPNSDSYELTTVDGEAIFSQTHDWDQLLEKSQAPFYWSRKWCEPWWHILAKGKKISSAIVQSKDEGTIGIASLAQIRYPIGGQRRFGPIVNVPLGYLVGSADHGGFLCSTGTEGQAAKEILTKWTTSWERDRTLLLPSFPRDEVVGTELEPMRFLSETRCPRATISAGQTWDQLTAKWTKNRRKKLRQKFDAFNTAEGHFQWIENPIDIHTAIDIAIDLHQQRWTSQGRRTAFGWNKDRHDFLHAVADHPGPGKLWCQLALIGGEPVGSLLGFQLHGRVHAYQSGWNPNYERFSIGLIQYAQAIRHAVETGSSEFDMCRGMEPYKLRFATDVLDERTIARVRGLAGLPITFSAQKARKSVSRAAQSEQSAKGFSND